ncbi:unnamed protein product [Toxocara canis]|uniref:Uncharacterized protein n=1 Tax=Toxocara canis TaxID=6265 RepID=A0A183TWW0_TOXCA|nr:unnamed protein product [Toxocara canis]
MTSQIQVATNRTIFGRSSHVRSGAAIIATYPHAADRTSGTHSRRPPDETSDSNAQTATTPQHRTATMYVRRRQQLVPPVVLDKSEVLGTCVLCH